MTISAHRSVFRNAAAAGMFALAFALSSVNAQVTQSLAPLPAQLAAARQALSGKEYARAKVLYRAFLHTHPQSIDAQLGLADSELGLREYEAAELDYRRVVAAQPQLWVAHKDLVIVEAELGRWSEFERERAVLRAARERGAPGISARESDVIDSFEVTVRGKPQRWIVREYFEPVGRSQARYNFECFSSAGRAEEYVSLEPTAAAKAALQPGDVRIGADMSSAQPSAKAEYSLSWYTGRAHGTIARYPHGEPAYERVRADFIHWLRTHPEAAQ